MKTFQQYTQVFLLLITGVLLTSCLKNQPAVKKAEEFGSSNINSYSDLFEEFWTTMDQRYNYFYEQEREDGLDWDKIHDIYAPKFAALKSLKRGAEFTDAQIINDGDSAKSYFTQIVDPIIDRHFVLKVRLPTSRAGSVNFDFRGGMLHPIKNNYISFNNKIKYMTPLLNNPLIQQDLSAFAAFGGSYPPGFICGTFKSNPDILYFSLADFLVVFNYGLDLSNSYGASTPDNPYFLAENTIRNSELLKAISDETLRTKALTTALNIYNAYQNFYNSDDIKKMNQLIPVFNTDEIVTDTMMTVANRIIQRSSSLPTVSTSLSRYSSDLRSNPAALAFITWFNGKMYDHNDRAYQFGNILPGMSMILTGGPLYQKLFNPLHAGKFKKIIVDLRGNGGGAALDMRFFTSRFITKVVPYAYQRTKEGAGRFDYTPWTSVNTVKNPYAMPNNVPMAVLLDKQSYSMSEISALAWMSQGKQVFTVGDYSAGATAGLGDAQEFNGGLQLQVNGRMFFYMPLMATKQLDGTVIEGKGVKPTYPVPYPTDEEYNILKNTPELFKDKVVETALEKLSAM